RFFATPLPLAEPYRLSAAASADGFARLSGNAPDNETAAVLSQAYAEASGATPGPETFTLATGLPFDTWPIAAAAGLSAVKALEDWQFDLTDREVRISGIAAGRAERAHVEERLANWATQYDLSLVSRLATGPKILPAQDVAGILSDLADCGPLLQGISEDAAYALGDTVRVTGTISDAAANAALSARLTEALGDRKLVLDTTMLNADICTVRNVLPVLPNNDLSIWVGDGDTGAANLSGIFRVNENPVVEVHAPANLVDASLWVVVVDNTGKVFNLLPNMNFEDQSLDRLGRLENGIRRVRVLHSIDEFRSDPRLLAMKISDKDFGKSEVLAILSRENLFGIRRPRDESVASFAEALTEIQAEKPGNIIGIATRLLDSRP
ncbi:MAG: serine/threonine protein kinase, partial [Paracoccaceae bacterium]|nr:serine/threonine protein kinase [Paracoccaceae bacterium]